MKTEYLIIYVLRFIIIVVIFQIFGCELSEHIYTNVSRNKCISTTVIHTSCSNFLLLTGGCSCNTQSARTFSVDLTASRAVVNGLRSSGLLDVDIPCRQVSTLSDQDICDANTIN